MDMTRAKEKAREREQGIKEIIVIK